MKTLVILSILLAQVYFSAAQQSADITGYLRSGSESVSGARVMILPDSTVRTSDDNGFFRTRVPASGGFRMLIRSGGFQDLDTVFSSLPSASLQLHLRAETAVGLHEISVHARSADFASGRLRDVSGTSIYAGKKTELIELKNINANLATNNTRQIYARIPGLNIWEYDRGGLQLGIGGRGLSPNRSSNFNIRQNGYDISADALGYPESYYTPSTEAVERIEIIRGAASLQYGPQFGGLVNFVMKEGPKNKLFELVSRQSMGSYGFFNTFNSVGGTVAKGKLNYYGFYQFKRGDDWRPNSHYEQHSAYAHLGWEIHPKLKFTGEYTLMKYLAQQPGGLTDAQFKADPSQSVRARNWFKVDWNLISLMLDYQIDSKTKLNFRSYTLQGGREALGVLSYINRPDGGGNRDLLSDEYSNFGSELRLLHQYSLSGEKQSTFLIGGRVYHGLTERFQGEAGNGSGPDFSFNSAEPDESGFRFPGINYAAFCENIFRIGEHWSVTPGIRFEYIDTKASGYYYKQNIFIAPERIAEERANPRSFVLLGIGTSRRFSNGTELYANISQNYRSINFNDIRVVNANARVDPRLKDETGFNIDLGYRGTYGGWLYFDASAFFLKYNDRIGSIFSRDTNFMTYRLRTNVADSRNLGLEMLLEGDLLKLISHGTSGFKGNLYANVSLIDARYINTKNTAIANRLVENVPPFMFRTGASFGNPRFNISLQYSYQEKQYSDATNTEVTPTAVDGAVPAFSVLDLSVSYNWRWFTLFSGVNNLTDSKYFTRRADGYPGPGILPADRRNVYVTLQFRL